MVYCGKPSKSCHACRQRKTRCDARPQGCSQCARVGRQCPGYRSQVDLIFRDQSHNVVRKAKARAAKASPKPWNVSSASSPLSDVVQPSSESTSGESVDEVVQGHGQLALFEPFAVDPIYSLGPTVEDRATCYFISNYATGVLLPGYNNFGRSDTSQLSIIMNTTLGASIKATSLASFAHHVRSSELAQLSRYHYTRAIQLTNTALASPAESIRDSTLLSTILLGLYEVLTGRNQRSMKDWAGHVHGAAALLRLRGKEQFNTPFTRRMFVQATSSLIACCMQRTIRLPQHVISMLDDLAEIMGSVGEFTRLGVSIVQTMVEFNQFRCDVEEGLFPSEEAIVARAKDIDQPLADIFENCPPEWRFDAIYQHKQSLGIVFGGVYHVYSDAWVANVWNSIRLFRALIHSQIREVLLQGFSARPPKFTQPQYTEQFQRSTDICYDMQAGILASVPQSLGYVRNTGLADSPPHETKNYSHEIADTPIGLSSSGYNLLHALWFAGFMDLATDDARAYCIASLEKIGNDMGIAQAYVFAQIIRSKEGPAVWNQDVR